MSGLEVVGVVLAAPPLILSFLEHYRQVFEYLGRWKKFRAEYRKCERQVRTIIARFDMILDRLFLPFAESETAFELLKNAPSDKAWVEVEAGLRRRLLPNVRPLYVRGMEDLQDAIHELQHVLAFDNRRFQEELRQGILTNTQRRALYKWEQHKFSSRAAPRAEAFGKVEQQLNTLRNLLVENDETTEIRALAARSWSRTPAGHITFWKHAQTAYRLITKSWCCTCRYDHRADLALLRYSSESIYLDIDFLFSQDADTTKVYPWSRLTTRVSKHDRQSGNAVDTASRSVDVLPNMAMRPSVTSTSQLVSPPDPTNALAGIADLCHEMSDSNSNDRWLGLLVDQHCADQYCVFLSGCSSSVPTGKPFVNLETLLTTPHLKPDRRVRYEIALIIVSSHLQLHSSSWLDIGWSSADIYFAMDNGRPRVEKPYLRRAFAAPPSDDTLPAFDLAFATIGLVLLELCFGKSLSDTPYRAKHLCPDGSANPVQDREAAWEWAKDVARESGQEYADAVDWCLGKWRVRGDDPVWRAQFHNNVVNVLETAFKKTWPELSLATW
ncbi:hypothetical protein D6D12_09352 [Aureobasidium pullulans]|uniref:DUF7580 domain-containing protein n=1 Tax=Aureobasidium pullulans TaxID=5580 RepID=A0AB74JGT3_AURPU|nr:hypothetical protein D6D12_09352 [Aureobasidium pullulans]THX32133.1 hypothetical protein D6D11_09860 [Aureobasidium pullulans]